MGAERFFLAEDFNLELGVLKEGDSRMEDACTWEGWRGRFREVRAQLDYVIVLRMSTRRCCTVPPGTRRCGWPVQASRRLSM